MLDQVVVRAEASLEPLLGPLADELAAVRVQVDRAGGVALEVVPPDQVAPRPVDGEPLSTRAPEPELLAREGEELTGGAVLDVPVAGDGVALDDVVGREVGERQSPVGDRGRVDRYAVERDALAGHRAQVEERRAAGSIAGERDPGAGPEVLRTAVEVEVDLHALDGDELRPLPGFVAMPTTRAGLLAA